MNEEQRKQRDARVAELAEETVAAWDRYQGEHKSLQEEIRASIKVALGEQAKEIAAAIERFRREPLTLAETLDLSPSKQLGRAADIAAGFGDDRTVAGCRCDGYGRFDPRCEASTHKSEP